MNRTDYPRVLVVSHAVFSDTTNTGITLSAFFQQWDPQAVAQLFFHSELPSSEGCQSYFRITDFDALRNVLCRSQCGRMVSKEEAEKIGDRPAAGPSPSQQVIYEFGRRKHPSTILARDTIWRLARWRSPALERWVDEFSPEVVFLAAGAYRFAYDIGRHIAESRRLPLVVFIGDDVYNICSFSLSPLFWLEKILIRKTMRQTLRRAACFLSTCDMMAEEYGRAFGIRYASLPVSCPAFAPSPQVREETPLTMSYIGNVLYFRRWTTLRRIGESLAKINRGGTKAVLNIFSTERLNPRMLALLTIDGTMAFKGSLTGPEVQKVISDSDVLVHVESMDKVNRRLTRLSFSTKIPQYLAGGKCLLAVGPEEVASLRYLRDHRVGLVVTDMKLLEEELARLLGDRALRQQYAANALRIAHERHDAHTNSHRFAELMREITAKGQGPPGISA